MAEELVMIALSPTMEEGQILTWKKQEGDPVEEGEILCEVETDKASMEYESQQTGTLLKIIKKAGESARIGELIGVLGEPGEDTEDFLRSISSATEANNTETSTTQETKASIPHPQASDPIPKRRIKASPLAKRLARDYQLKLEEIEGTGPQKRIVKRDIEKARVQATQTHTTTSEGDTIINLSTKRQIIAKRLSESKYTMPHYYMTLSIRMDKLIEARAEHNRTRTERIGLNAYLMKFVAEALKKHPLMNSSFEGTQIRLFGSIDIGLAVAQEDGVITPIIRACGTKGILQIAAEVQELTHRARAGKLTPPEFQGATFTISNLGAYGIDAFTSIINPPAAAILAIGAAQRQQVVTDQDKLEIQTLMRVTLSCDHRVIDGAIAATFLRDLKKMIEQPLHALY